MLAVDLHGRKARGQCAAGHDVLHADLVGLVVEIDGVSGAHIHRANAQSDFLPVDAIEIDQPFQCRLQRLGVVVAQHTGTATKQKCRVGPWPKETRNAGQGGAGSAPLVQPRAITPRGRHILRRARRDLLPELG